MFVFNFSLRNNNMSIVITQIQAQQLLENWSKNPWFFTGMFFKNINDPNFVQHVKIINFLKKLSHEKLRNNRNNGAIEIPFKMFNNICMS